MASPESPQLREDEWDVDDYSFEFDVSPFFGGSADETALEPNGIDFLALKNSKRSKLSKKSKLFKLDSAFLSWQWTRQTPTRIHPWKSQKEEVLTTYSQAMRQMSTQCLRLINLKRRWLQVGSVIRALWSVELTSDWLYYCFKRSELKTSWFFKIWRIFKKENSD